MSRFPHAFSLGLVLCIAAGLVLPATAHAGRRAFTWIYDTEVVPERGAEIETWVTDRVQPTPKDTRDFWWAPIVGLTDRIELALPMELQWSQATDKTQVLDYGAELRIRLANPDRLLAGPAVTALRVGLYRPLRGKDAVRPELDVIESLDIGEHLHVVANLGARYSEYGGGLVAAYGLGAQWTASEAWRFGLESFGIRGLVAPDVPNAKVNPGFTVVGPTVGLTHGRTWITFGMLKGVTDNAPVYMSRLLWAIAF